MNEEIKCRRIEYGSEIQVETIDLRREILRRPLGLDFNPDELASEKDQFHFAAFFKQKTVAVLLFKVSESGVLKMRQVAVKQDFQNMQIGRTLVLFSENWAKEHGFHRIELHARATAVDFYKNMEYQISGSVFEEVSIPHFAMFKNI